MFFWLYCRKRNHQTNFGPNYHVTSIDSIPNSQRYCLKKSVICITNNPIRCSMAHMVLGFVSQLTFTNRYC